MSFRATAGALTAVVAALALGLACGSVPEGQAVRDPGGAPTVQTAKAALVIEGMTCGSCASTARLALKRSPGVLDADVSYESRTGLVWYDSTLTSPGRFIADLGRMTGYRAAVTEQGGVSAHP